MPVPSWLAASFGQSIMILLTFFSLVFAMTALLQKVMPHKIINSDRTLLEVFIS